MNELIKKCLVCGDRAIGNNFDALSCESCKAFFRRNAIKDKEFRCHFDNNCKIDLLTRRFCKRCRLKKCYDIGMKRDWILSEEEKQQRKVKIESNKKKRKFSENDSNSSTSPDTHNSDTGDTLLLDIPDTFGDLDIDVSVINTQISEIESFIKEEDSNEISDLVYQKAVELEFSVIPIARPLNDFGNYSFNELEGSKLYELMNATTIMKLELKPATYQINTYDELCVIMGVKFEREIRNLIRMSKNLTAFNGICENDKLALIRYGCMELYCLRSIISFDSKTDSWLIDIHNNSSAIVSLNCYRDLPRDLYGAYKRYLHKMSNEWDNDPIILDLMTAITLFSPERPGLIYKELVKLQQHIYMYLLQRYLKLKYGSESESKTRFLKLLNVSIDVSVLGQTYMKNCSEKDPERVTPLLREIYGIRAPSDPVDKKPFDLLVF